MIFHISPISCDIEKLPLIWKIYHFYLFFTRKCNLFFTILLILQENVKVKTKWSRNSKRVNIKRAVIWLIATSQQSII